MRLLFWESHQLPVSISNFKLTDDLHVVPVLTSGQEILREVVELAAAEEQLTEGEALGVQWVEGVRVDERQARVIPVSRVEEEELSNHFMQMCLYLCTWNLYT